MGRWMWFLASFAIATSAGATALCARQRADGSFNATVKIRDSCRSTETHLDPASLGLQGPKGDPGSQGPPGPSPGFTCTSSCLSGFPTADFDCGGNAMSCRSPNGFDPARATFIACQTDDALAFRFCLTAKCDGGVCPGETPPQRCVADPSITVEVDACHAVEGELAYFAENTVYVTSGDCTTLPGFAPSPGVSCVLAATTCAFGGPGFVIRTMSADPNATVHTCTFDSCPASGDYLVCS
jgi:hypothetical protein